jgi:glutamyl-Q tRNA(Asp) synthetase
MLAAIGSYLDAKSRRGEWLVRIEDLDRDREVPGAASDILRTLESFGLDWDAEVWRQSERGGAYAQALERLEALELVYPCFCSRSELARHVPTQTATGVDAPVERIYPGFCRRNRARRSGPHAVRFDTSRYGPVVITDRLQGMVRSNVATDVGDFVLKRRDGFHAYQLAVVVDDAAQGITDVVRGLDLLDNTPRQWLLQDALQLAHPRYLHLPLVVDQQSLKLAKSRSALPANAADAPRCMTWILSALGHAPPRELAGAPPRQQLDWAVKNWNMYNIHNIMHVFSTDFSCLN